MTDSCDYTPLAVVGIVLMVILVIFILCLVVTSLVKDNCLSNVISNIIIILIYIWFIYIFADLWRQGQHVTVVVVTLFILVIISLPWVVSACSY